MTQQTSDNLNRQPAQSIYSKRLLRWMLLFGVAAVGFVCWKLGFASKPLPEIVQQLGLDPASPAAPIVFFFIALVLVSTVLPKTAASISAGFLFGTLTGGVLITLISITAAISNYAIGRWLLGDSIARRLTNQDSVTTPAWAIAIHDLATDAGYGFHLLFRFATIPSMLLNYFMGAVRARIAPFMFASLIGVLPQLLWAHGASVASMDNQEISSGRWISSVVSIFAAIAITILVPREVMRRIKRIQNDRQQASRS